MTDKDAVNTPENTKKRIYGKPFVKGDKRINRRGRPTLTQIGERTQWQEVFAEYVLDDKGNPVIDEVTKKPLTRLRARMKIATTSRNPRDFEIALDRAFGKVKEQVENTGNITLTVVYKDKDGLPDNLTETPPETT